MNRNTQYEKIPLTADDRDMLMTIYNNRLKYGTRFYLYWAALSLSYCSVLYFKKSDSEPGDLGPAQGSGLVHPEFIVFWPGALILLIPILGAGTYYIYKKVWTFKMDIDNGVKIKVPYVIQRKEYFAITDEYYFGLDDPNYLHHQVDESFFNQCDEGDTIYLYRAPLSGYTFEMNGRFTL